MALGYETYEDTRDFEQEGLTGEVARYSTEHMTFPCFIICSTEDNIVEEYKTKTVKSMFVSPSDKFDEETFNSVINIYFHIQGQTIRYGKILPKQVKSFLKLFEGNIVEGYYDKDTKLTDDYLYVLAE